MEFTILMPCLDEALTIESCVRRARGYLDEHGIEGEILVADNGSTDGSPLRARAAGARVVHVPRKGYGAALIGGIEAAKGRYVIMADADESYDFGHLDAFVEGLRRGLQLVVGNRFSGDIHPGAMPFLNRYIGNPVLSLIGRILFAAPVGDFHCGLRGFDREAILGLRLHSTGMEFASEMVVKASMARLSIAEVPTTLRRDGRDRAPHLQPWRDGWRHLRFMLLRSPTWLFVYPGLLLTVLASSAAVWVTMEPRQLISITLDVNALLYFCTAAIVGVQIVYFGLFAMAVADRLRLRMTSALGDRLLRWASSKPAIAVGSVLAFVGVAGAIYAVIEWGNASFGALVPSHMMRITIPAVTTLAVGMQVLLGSLLLSFIDIES
jgi:glycosyltransferase involved in cell wall biosynthesis